MDLSSQLKHAEETNERVRSLLSGSFSTDQKLRLVLQYLNLTQDNLRAMLFLIRNRYEGPALSLVRFSFECMVRAHWVAKCATDGQVDEIEAGQDRAFDKKSMGSLTQEVDAAFSDSSAEQLTFFNQAKRDAWDDLNSYAHPGGRHLIHQITDDCLNARYPQPVLTSGVSAATASVVLIAYLLLKALGRDPEAEELLGTIWED